MNFATKSSRTRIFVWLIWFIALLAFAQPTTTDNTTAPATTSLLGVISHNPQNGALFPWQPRYRWKQRALRKYKAWKRAYRRAKWAARWARLAMMGATTVAQLVDLLTKRQLHYQIGALPVLYALLETLQVRHIINRHCPTRREVDHGTVALVLVLNRLMYPAALYRVADWVGRTTLVHVLGIPASKFNDDRLERTLDALFPHLETIWLEVVERAICKANIDLSVIFYDLTAFVAHGRYEDSDYVDFGFAHNTPSNKRKFKLGLNATADGNIPWLYQLWSGRTADQSTVASNMNTLASWLKKRGYRLEETLVIGDRAMLDDKIAHAYDQHGLRYLAGLRCLKKEHKELLTRWPTSQFEEYPIVEGSDPQYWGRGCTVTFEHEGCTIHHRGLVILAGPLRDQIQASREEHLAVLGNELRLLKAKIGQPYYRTVNCVRRSANARCKESKVGRFMSVSVHKTEDGQVDLQWQIDTDTLWKAKEKEGRYLLVTNDKSLSHQEMFALYREKDGVEKRFYISKSDLKVSPIYLHKDERIASMLLLNMIALLAYSLLERQIRQQGLQLTTRELIKRLETVSLIETHCHDGSCLRRLTPIEPEITLILDLVREALQELIVSPAMSKMPLLAVDVTEPAPLLVDMLC
jgi:transposase